MLETLLCMHVCVEISPPNRNPNLNSQVMYDGDTLAAVVYVNASAHDSQEYLAMFKELAWEVWVRVRISVGFGSGFGLGVA